VIGALCARSRSRFEGPYSPRTTPTDQVALRPPDHLRRQAAPRRSRSSTFTKKQDRPRFGQQDRQARVRRRHRDQCQDHVSALQRCSRWARRRAITGKGHSLLAHAQKTFGSQGRPAAITIAAAHHHQRFELRRRPACRPRAPVTGGRVRGAPQGIRSGEQAGGGGGGGGAAVRAVPACAGRERLCWSSRERLCGRRRERPAGACASGSGGSCASGSAEQARGLCGRRWRCSAEQARGWLCERRFRFSLVEQGASGSAGAGAIGSVCEQARAARGPCAGGPQAPARVGSAALVSGALRRCAGGLCLEQAAIGSASRRYAALRAPCELCSAGSGAKRPLRSPCGGSLEHARCGSAGSGRVAPHRRRERLCGAFAGGSSGSGASASAKPVGGWAPAGAGRERLAKGRAQVSRWRRARVLAGRCRRQAACGCMR